MDRCSKEKGLVEADQRKDLLQWAWPIRVAGMFVFVLVVRVCTSLAKMVNFSAVIGCANISNRAKKKVSIAYQLLSLLREKKLKSE